MQFILEVPRELIGNGTKPRSKSNCADDVDRAGILSTFQRFLV